MSEPENFLSRWSRRKLDGGETTAEPQRSEDVAPAAESEAAAVAVPQAQNRESPEKPEKQDRQVEQKDETLDLASLPSLDEITAQTDIRAFLQKGVPAQLTRAALRRAWLADPQIRDFIEVAENQWDFATGADLPGFGALDASPEEIRRLVADVFGERLNIATPASTAPETAMDAASPDEEGAVVAAQEDVTAAGQEQPLPVAIDNKDMMQRSEVDAALQQSITKDEYKVVARRRPHGGALPQ